MHVYNSQRLTYAMMNPTSQTAQLLYELDQDPEVMRYINDGKANSFEEIERIFIPRLAKYYNPTQGWGLHQVNHIVTGQYLGWILVRPMGFFGSKPEYDNVELGWRFKRDTWGQGFATEAARSIMEALVTQYGVQVFSAIAHPENTASINVMKKLGMRFLKSGGHPDLDGEHEVVYYQIRLIRPDS